MNLGCIQDKIETGLQHVSRFLDGADEKSLGSREVAPATKATGLLVRQKPETRERISWNLEDKEEVTNLTLKVIGKKTIREWLSRSCACLYPMVIKMPHIHPS